MTRGSSAALQLVVALAEGRVGGHRGLERAPGDPGCRGLQDRRVGGMAGVEVERRTAETGVAHGGESSVRLGR
jgi:hypothetical protein